MIPAGRPRLPLVLCSLLLAASCRTPEPAPVIVPPRSDLVVLAPYTATLAYALDGAAGRPRHDEGYRDWLLGEDDPAWMKDFRRSRDRLPAQRDEGDGYHDPYLAAAYAAADLASLRVEVEAMAEAEVSGPVLLALDTADATLRPRFERRRAELEQARVELARLTQRPEARRLLDELRTSCGLDPAQALNFRVILVAKPEGPHTYAHHQGANLVLEWPKGQDPRRVLGIVFHEIAHLAVHHSRAVDSLESFLRGRGLLGALAGNYWNETYATGFGNGHAASVLDPRHRPDQSLYAEPTIDVLGRSVAERWRREGAPKLGPEFGQWVLDAFQERWPRESWTLGNLVFRQAAFGDDSEALQTYIATSASSWTSAQIPLPPDLRVPDGIPGGVPRVFLVLRSTLRAREDLRAAVGVEASEIDTQLADSPARWHLGLAPDGAATLMLVARDPIALRQACAAFQPDRLLPEPGWFDG